MHLSKGVADTNAFVLQCMSFVFWCRHYDMGEVANICVRYLNSVVSFPSGKTNRDPLINLCPNNADLG
jgi:hypothetical protein